MVVKRIKKHLEVERTPKGIICYPRFYIKMTGGMYSVYHRLTHAFIGNMSTEEELVPFIELWESKSEEDVWREISRQSFSLDTLKTSIVHRKDDAEDWYYGAWGTYTTKFYEAHPHLMNEVKTFPMDVINSIRQEKAIATKRAHEKHVEQLEQKEEEYKVGKINLPKVNIPKPEPISEPVKSKPVKQSIRRPLKKKPTPEVKPKPKKPTAFKLPKIKLP